MMPHRSIFIQFYVVMIEIRFINISLGLPLRLVTNRLAHGGPIAYASEQRPHLRESAEVDFGDLRPAEDGIQIRIGHRKRCPPNKYCPPSPSCRST